MWSESCYVHGVIVANHIHPTDTQITLTPYSSAANFVCPGTINAIVVAWHPFDSLVWSVWGMGHATSKRSYSKDHCLFSDCVVGLVSGSGGIRMFGFSARKSPSWTGGVDDVCCIVGAVVRFSRVAGDVATLQIRLMHCSQTDSSIWHSFSASFF